MEAVQTTCKANGRPYILSLLSDSGSISSSFWLRVLSKQMCSRGGSGESLWPYLLVWTAERFLWLLHVYEERCAVDRCTAGSHLKDSSPQLQNNNVSCLPLVTASLADSCNFICPDFSTPIEWGEWNFTWGALTNDKHVRNGGGYVLLVYFSRWWSAPMSINLSLLEL